MFLQREEENVGIQDIDDQAVGDAINVAEKAVNNLDKK